VSLPSPDVELILPLHRSTIVQRATTEEGAPLLRLFHGQKEISFDEPELFGFAETLARTARFRATEATGWGQGQSWERVAPLLGALLEEGILRVAGPGDEEEPPGREFEFDSPLPPAPCAHPQTWDDVEARMRELTGQPLEAGYLELVVPVFRVVHPYLDDEGRQVGEANVFPPALRLDVPTQWRGCRYAGSRYQLEKPMNITALRSMRAYWPQMMALLGRIRAAFVARSPSRPAGLTVAQVERLTVAVLAVPTWLMVNRRHRLPNGQLPAAMSSLFRVTDGLRMVVHQMLFVPVGERVRQPDEVVDAATIYDYAERNHAFHSEHAVCAGPQAMVQEFLRVLVEGASPRDSQPLDETLEVMLADIDRAFDYGLRGLQAHAAAFSIFPAMTRCYEQLRGAATQWAADSGVAPVRELAERLDGHLRTMRTRSYLGEEAWRADRERVYDDMFEAAGRFAGDADCVSTLSGRTAPVDRAGDSAARAALAAAIAARCGAGVDVGAGRDYVHFLFGFLQRTRALLAEAVRAQGAVNSVLGRPAPRRPFAAGDLDLHNRLRGAAVEQLPYLLNEVMEYFRVRIVVTPEAIEITGAPGDRG
jgi:hypothetical protein